MIGQKPGDVIAAFRLFLEHLSKHRMGFFRRTASQSVDRQVDEFLALRSRRHPLDLRVDLTQDFVVSGHGFRLDLSRNVCDGRSL